MTEIEFPKHVSYLHHDERTTHPTVVFFEDLKAKLIADGFVYIKVNSGDYKGSIAKFIPDGIESREFVSRFGFRSGGSTIYNSSFYIYGRLKWKGKSNNPKFTISCYNCTLLPECEWNDTLLCRFDKKAAADAVMQQIDVKDCDGNELQIGDSVLYINARYGGGARLSHGTITEFKPRIRPAGITVIIQNDADLEEFSKCQYSTDQIYKK